MDIHELTEIASGYFLTHFYIHNTKTAMVIFREIYCFLETVDNLLKYFK